MKKVIFTQLIFIIAMFLLQGFAQADIPGTGTVTQIVEPSMPDTLYLGKIYYIHAIAKDVGDNPVGSTGCAVESFKGTVVTDDTQFIDRARTKWWCKEDKTTLTCLPIDCFYTTFENGHISIPFFINPILYEAGETYTFQLTCEGITISQIATVHGYSEKIENGGLPDTCNVESVLIGDGTDSTTDSFDENPNKYDTLHVNFALTSLNTLCIDEKITYKVLRDVNGTMINHSEIFETITTNNQEGIILLNIDGTYFVGGEYQLVVMADDKQDVVNFTVSNMKQSVEGYETLDWAKQNTNGLLALIALFMLIIIGLIIIFKLAF